MKNRKTNFIKLGILLFGISLFLINCEKEDDTIKNQSNYKTVSINEALSYFNSNEKLRNSSKSYNETYVNPNLNNIYQEKLINSSEALTIVEAKTVFSKHYSRIVMLKINDEIKNVVFSMYPTNSSNKDYFSGEILITDLEGNFLNGFRVKEGIIVSKFIKTTALNKSSNYGNESTDEVCEFHGANNPDCILNMETDEVVVKVKRTAYISVVDLYGGGDFTESDNTCEVGCESWDYGGGGINTNDSPTCLGGKVYNATSKKCECPEGKVEDGSGNCIDDPCKKISSQILNANFKAKKEELEKVTSKKQETGYVENKTGTFTKLNPINGGHSLDLSGISYSNINGFIHTHLNNFETGEIDVKTGNPKINEIYRIFSPADVLAFLAIAKRSTDISNVYATVIASSGDYTLKFTGNQSDIKNLKDAEDYRADYINMMKKGKEKGFLHFLKNYIKIDGIELYKLHKPLFSSTIKVQKKSLTPNGKVECQ